MVLDLRDAEALDAGVVGGKAAALARALRGGLTPLPGVVLTTAFSDVVDRARRSLTIPPSARPSSGPAETPAR